ncbi:nitroreductase/quinone reductase family protein [Actinophytocola gossypii]|uniref:Nitroreductase family deazaflavin-dependent oxidoreductase n=1 Tax=Actinophytocola gossypii TaxID=2812003 RepID=A0ABT2J160_9PSEU|nr:nitroreductase/quinone reductase family protein [Actinophytocola gossypii]MCT2581600.1 nitroreductase family deazaflavin-dependent oxidoreductase [Actinophytocola gossypii]
MHDFNQQVIDEFRANTGRVGGPFENARLILLTTTGARTGAEHTTPLGYLPDEDAERIIVIASAGGSPRHPAWFHNLVANPKVTVENGPFTYEAEANVLTGTERDDVFARAVEADPGWADYETRSGRILPVVALRQVAFAPSESTSFGQMLRMIHDAFRRELAIIRTEFAASGPGIGVQLRVNCLSVCQGLHHHHRMEDSGLFPQLDESHPELEPVLTRLRAEHETIAALIDELNDAVKQGTDAQPRVERLVDELEAHLRYEEEQLIPILDHAG